MTSAEYRSLLMEERALATRVGELQRELGAEPLDGWPILGRLLPELAELDATRAKLERVANRLELN